MAFLKKRRKNLEKEVDSLDEIYVLKTKVIFKIPNEDGVNEKYGTLHILAMKEKKAYYEFFTNSKIEKGLNIHLDEYSCFEFYILYVEDVKSIAEYLDE